MGGPTNEDWIALQDELLSAIGAGRVDRVRELLASGVDANVRNGQGATALMHAAHRGNLPLVRALLAGRTLARPIPQVGLR